VLFAGQVGDAAPDVQDALERPIHWRRPGLCSVTIDGNDVFS
jgi:hypothetical protein